LNPDVVDVAVVVEPHAFAAAAVDQEEVRDLLAAGAEEGGAEGGHEAGDAGEDLMGLGEVDGGAAVEVDAAAAADAPVEDGVEGKPVAEPAGAGGEARGEVAPGVVAGKEQGRPAGQAGAASEPAFEDGVHSFSSSARGAWMASAQIW
jgi:hypothetical protein